MKKLLVVAVVLAIACLSSVAFAADVTVNGYVDVRSRLFENFDLNKSMNMADGTSRTTTETAFRIDVNVKGDNAKAKLSLWNDHDTWAQNSKHNPDNQLNINNTGVGGTGTATSTANIREAWLDVMIPDTPVGVKAGHQLLMIGNGWFFRENYGGVDAWVVYSKLGSATVAVQDVKLNENSTVGNSNTNANDVDLYTAMGTMKMGANTLGIDLSVLKDDTGTYLGTAGWTTTQTQAYAGATGLNQKGRLYNLGLNFNGKVGPATIKAEVDLQQGMVENAAGARGYTGNQVVVQASMPMDKLTLNATVARGSGNVANQGKTTQFSNFMDIGQHYTFLYEYRIAGASGALNTGFANTTAVSVGGMFQAAKSVAVGADLWFLRATEQTNVARTNGTGALSRELGMELDVKANWQLTKEVSWNWQFGYFKPGAAYNSLDKADPAYGAQGILSMTF